MATRPKSPYPTPNDIYYMLGSLSTSDPSPFYSRVSPTVTWEVMGTHPAAGRFTSLADWKAGALGKINAVLKEPLKLKVVNVTGGDDQAWAAAELQADSVCLNGMEYKQRYCWMLKFNDDGVVVEARAYLDSALVQKAIDENTMLEGKASSRMD